MKLDLLGGVNAAGTASGIWGTVEMYKGFKNLTNAQNPENKDSQGEFFKEMHANHNTGVSLLTGSAIITAITSGDFSYLASQLTSFQPAATVNYYNSHPEEFEKLHPLVKPIVEFLQENIHLESIVGANIVVFLSFLHAGADEMTLLQLFGASTISTALSAGEVLRQKSPQLGALHFQILLLAGRLGMLSPSVYKMIESFSQGDINPGSIAWTTFMGVFSVLSVGLVKDSFQAQNESNAYLTWKGVFSDLGKTIKEISSDIATTVSTHPASEEVFNQWNIAKEELQRITTMTKS